MNRAIETQTPGSTRGAMKYAVHMYTQVRVKVIGVEAGGIAEALQKAHNAVDFHDLLDNKALRTSASEGMGVEYVEWTEGPPEYACVDPLLENGEIDYDNSRFVGSDGESLDDGETVEERKAAGFDAARLFMQELLDSEEALVRIAEQCGARTLADLWCLQQAILSGGFIDHYPDESKVLALAQGLPSGERWEKYIKVEYLTVTTEDASQLP